MRSKLLVPIAVVALVAASVLAGTEARAAHPGNPCLGDVGTIAGTPDLEDGTVLNVNGAFYVDVREVATQYAMASVWVYQESNGAEGLQRGSSTSPEPFPFIRTTLYGPGAANDPCVESSNPDAHLL